MANVLYEEKKQQVLALGRLGWPLRQIQKPPASAAKASGFLLTALSNARPNTPSSGFCRVRASDKGITAIKHLPQPATGKACGTPKMTMIIRSVERIGRAIRLWEPGVGTPAPLGPTVCDTRHSNRRLVGDIIPPVLRELSECTVGLHIRRANAVTRTVEPCRQLASPLSSVRQRT